MASAIIIIIIHSYYNYFVIIVCFELLFYFTEIFIKPCQIRNKNSEKIPPCKLADVQAINHTIVMATRLCFPIKLSVNEGKKEKKTLNPNISLGFRVFFWTLIPSPTTGWSPNITVRKRKKFFYQVSPFIYT